MLENSSILDQYLLEASKEGRLTYKKDLELKNVTSFKIGGLASYAVYPMNTDELSSLCGLCRGIGVPFYVVGNTSNLLFEDSGYDGVLVFTTAITGIEIKDTSVTCECGASITHLSSICAKAGLCGLEFAYGIPGTVGGAVYMNAGAYGGEMKDVIRNVTYYDIENDEIVTVSLEECKFGYRESIFQDGSKVVLSTEMVLATADSEKIIAVMNEHMQARIDKQPLSYPSAGSVFKRYPGYFSGKLIEEAGLKGFSIGGAQVSEKHAGFIINTGDATCKDVLDLIKHIQDVIFDRVGIHLECEVRHVVNPYGKV